jgi:hypothetical protein
MPLQESIVKSFLALFGCLLLSAVAHAAPAVTAYDVEVVVFENMLPELEGGELWIRDAAEPATRMPDVSDALVVGQLVPVESVLAGAAATLQRSGTYRVLAHRRWRQTAEEKSAAKPVRLSSPDAQLDGTLRFYVSRFLHVDVDLVLQQQTAVVDQSAVLGVNYRLTEHRRIKTMDINYFDHPKLGALVRITPVGKE